MNKLVFIVVLLLTFVMVMFCVAYGFSLMPTDFDKTEYETIEYRVKSGDTLWDLANRFCRDDDSVSDWITAVNRLNSIDNTIYTGEVITIYRAK